MQIEPPDRPVPCPPIGSDHQLSRSRSCLRLRLLNIAYGSYYLRYLLDRYDGSKMSLAAYNGARDQRRRMGGEGPRARAEPGDLTDPVPGDEGLCAARASGPAGLTGRPTATQLGLPPTVVSLPSPRPARGESAPRARSATSCATSSIARPTSAAPPMYQGHGPSTVSSD